jgi:dCMP deaminase
MTKTENRPSWDAYFMNITNLVAERSTCLRRAVGAVLVKDKRILSTGYNGAPATLKHCAEVGCLREQLGIESGKMHELCRGIHAEQNAMSFAGEFMLNKMRLFRPPTTVFRLKVPSFTAPINPVPSVPG